MIEEAEERPPGPSGGIAQRKAADTVAAAGPSISAKRYGSGTGRRGDGQRIEQVVRLRSKAFVSLADIFNGFRRLFNVVRPAGVLVANLRAGPNLRQIFAID